MNRVRSRLDNERGLTLIELIISLGVLSVVIIPLTSSFLIGLLESNSTRDRVADSSSAQAISAYLMSDVQSSDTVATTGSSCLPAAGAGETNTVVLQLSWTDPKAPNPVTTVAYLDHETSGSAQHSLIRSECNGSGTKTFEIAGYIDDPPNGFKVYCDGVLGSCSNTSKLVKVEISAKSKAPSSNSSYTPFAFEFEVRRRVA